MGINTTNFKFTSMKKLLYSFCFLSLFACKKSANHTVEIYLLKSFSVNTDTSTPFRLISIVDPVLETTPLIANSDIKSYTKATSTFSLNKDINDQLKGFGNNTGFAVVVDQKPVYYGRFHPLYMSSMTLGIATIDPILSGNSVPVSFITIDDQPAMKTMDKRNDAVLLNAFDATGRLK